MLFEHNNRVYPLEQMNPPQWDAAEDEIYLFLNSNPTEEQAEAARRDLRRLGEALGRIACHE